MRDFTLNAYKNYIQILIKNYESILRFDEYFSLNKIPESFIIIRHDVDRRPKRSLNMAQVEKSLGICSTYYFRMKKMLF